jgi:hypothetical protein
MWTGQSVHKSPLNVYDSFSPRICNAHRVAGAGSRAPWSSKNGDYLHLFGNQNIGALEACNL